MKKNTIKKCIVGAFVSLFFTIGIPIIINELYKINNGYQTVWDGADVLSFYSVILSGIITIFIFCATIFYSKKDTEKQLKFYLSQSSVPFFVVDTVEDDREEYKKNADYSWNKTIDSILIEDSEKKQIELKHPDSSTLKINLKNVGEGLALNVNCTKQIQNIDIVKYHNQIVNKESITTIKFNIIEYLNKKSREEEQTSIVIKYQNASGMDFSQEIIIKFEEELRNHRINIIVCEMSPRKQC